MKRSSRNIQNLEQREGHLVCPSCGEFLSRQDVEHYFRCPYCDYHFLLDGNMEDFLLKPVVDHWCQMNLDSMLPPNTTEDQGEVPRSHWI